MKYNDLNTEQKEQARSWWIEREEQDPAWIDEHNASLAAAVSQCKQGFTLDEIEAFRNCDVTGYTDDALLTDLQAIDKMAIYEESKIRSFYQAAWDKEMDFRLSDIEEIECSIIANDYDFKLKAVIA